MAVMMSGGADAKTKAAVRNISAAPEEARSALAEAVGQAWPRTGPEQDRFAERVIASISEPVEHLRSPERLYAAAKACGLKAMIRHDDWVRVMEPETVTVREGANRLFAAPPAPEMTETQKTFRIFCRFLSIEGRGDGIERELEEFGYTLDDLHDALNETERWLRFDPELQFLPRKTRDTLCVISAELLGKGHGETLRVERFADSLGMDRGALHRALLRFSEPAGFDTGWLGGDEAAEAERAMTREDAPSP